MRILMEASPVAYAYLNPLANTGIARVCRNLIHQLNALAGAELKLVLFSPENYFHNFLLQKFVTDHSLANCEVPTDGVLLPYFAARGLFTKDVQGIRQALEEAPFDLVSYLSPVLPAIDIYHSQFSRIPAAIRARESIRVLHTLHDLFPLTHPYLFTPDVRLAFRKTLASFAEDDYFAAVSGYTAGQIAEHLLGVDPRRIRTINNAADHFDALPVTRDDADAVLARFGLVRRQYFVSVSTLEPRKNFPSIIRAFRQYVETRGSSDKLVVVGATGWIDDSGELAKQLQRTAAGIVFAGRLDDQTMYALLANSSAYISGSVCEGFGLGALEAMHYGVIPICPNNSAQAEVVADIGILVNDWYPSAIAAAMARARLPETTAKFALARTRLAARFSWAKAANAYAQFYEDIFIEKSAVRNRQENK